MADTIAFELVSPERLLLAQPVEMVVVPGTEGNFGVLPGHAPLISTVRPGVIEIFEGGRVAERIFVAGGFAEVTPQRCTVLAERATPVADIDRATVERKLRDDREDGNAAEVAIGEAMLAAVEAPVQH
ncbi:MAG: F0F1 ATP synthase subunit epsilon [Alphaproteobacteria bacterium]|nr:F0F1 ATP synthase subunit epsilon [Alphaproteobacteria bacterium]